MSWWQGWRARGRDLFRPRDADERIEEELQFHLDMETAALERTGLPRAEAMRRAHAAFGGVAGHRDTMRSGHRMSLLSDVVRDTRFAGRSLQRDPAFWGASTLVLGLGIGAATAMVSVAGAFQQDLRTVHNVNTIAVARFAPAADANDQIPWSWRELDEYRRRSAVAEQVAGVVFQGATGVVFTDGSDAWPAAATWVTGDFFGVLGVQPALGRVLLPSDDQPGAEPVMVISHAAWQEQFGGRPDVLGRTLDLGTRRHRVVGVLPRGFEFPRRVNAWLPVLPSFPATQEPSRQGADVMLFDAVIRLRRGVSLESLGADLSLFLKRTEATRLFAERGRQAVVESFAARLSPTLRPVIRAASTAVVLLLLLACANAANLLLLRMARRQQELATRFVLGATPSRLVRQLAVEAGVLAFGGGLLGLLLAWCATLGLRVLAPAELPHRALIGLDGRAFSVALLLTALVALLCGVLPAFLSIRRDAHAPMLGAGWRIGRGHAYPVARGLLVAAQVALATIVVIAAGLVTLSFWSMQRVDLGFDARGLTIAEVHLAAVDDSDRPRHEAAQTALLASVRALPEVESVAAISKPPFAAEGGWVAAISADGQDAQDAANQPFVDLEVATAGYFETVGMRLLEGRVFDGRDRIEAPAVVVLSAPLARRLWSDGAAVGRRVKFGPPDGRAPWMEVVGVVAETRFRDLSTPRGAVYLPAAQFRGPVPLTLVLRTAAGTGLAADAAERAIREASADARLVSLGTFEQRLRRPMARTRFAAAVFIVCAAVTLLLSILGVGASMAALVRERRRELGIRLALGEPPRAIRRRVLRRAATISLVGLAIGALVGTLDLPWLDTLGTTTDVVAWPVRWAAVLLVGCASLAAAWWPARRAARIDPLRVLREAAS